MKTKNIFLTVALALSTTFAFAQIDGSAHDFAAGASWNTTGEICVTCHTPHNKYTVVTTPLWNRELSAKDFTATLYTSSTFDATDGGNPSGASRLCLGCHDGTVALDNFSNTSGGSVFTTKQVGETADGLKGEHPVSFSYANSVSSGDTGLNLESDVVTAGLLTAAGGNVECSSCHDVHNAGFSSLLRMSNANSALCLTCHAK